jgi:asparagine N-glycosylation enzyme membrane subunit Stt3
MSKPIPPQGEIELSPIPIPLTVQYAPRSVTMHTLTGAELDMVASLGNSVHLTFFGLCTGAAIAFGVVLSTSTITDPLNHAEFVALLAVSSALSLYFGIRALVDYKAARRKLKEIKAGQ